MTESDDQSKAYMKEIHRLNKRYERAVKAGGPEVGIFWIVDGKLIVVGKPLSEGVRLGDIKASSDTHKHIWKAFQQAGGVPKAMRYDEAPRGRVVYNMKIRQFLIIADPCIVASSAALNEIKNRLRIPVSQSQTGVDEHYRCPACAPRRTRKQEK